MASFTVFPYPVANGCSNFNVNCSDPNSVLIYVILSIAKTNSNYEGVTFSQIQTHLASICPQISWTSDVLEINLKHALRRGLLTTVYQPNNTSEHLYAVNAGMLRVNPANKKYFCIGQFYTS